MGYTTEFSGKLTITPPLSEELTDEINQFCEERHGGHSSRFPGFPGYWCDWKTDGQKLFWNGSEKSYEMDEWLELLIKKFLVPHGHTVNGRMLAQGEDSNDVWVLEAKDNAVRQLKVNVKQDFGITD
jgi:hypothetical protein